MADQTAELTDIETPAPSKKGGGAKLLVVGVVAAIILGGAGYYLTSSGIIALPSPGNEKSAGSHGEAPSHDAVPENITFIPLDTILVSLAGSSKVKHLKFTGELEVEPSEMEYVQQVMPRIQDVLNTYLRAVEVRDIEKPASAMMLRAQMLRRVQVVAGEGRVRDILVTEFVLN